MIELTLPRTPSFRLDGRRALVAGASSGIGLGCAVALAEAGAEVTLAARSSEKLKAVADAFKVAGLAAQIMPLDVAEVDDVKAHLSDVAPYQVLVNSAGAARHTPAFETQPKDFDAVMGLNLRGAYFLSQQVAAGMQKAGRGGSIINISSQMGHVGGVDRAVYCASKHGVEGMTKAMAIEWGRYRIRVNTICPTFVRTPLTEPTFTDPERVAWIESKIKLGRVGQVEDIMGAVVFLASDAAALITGTSLLIDGGWTAG